MNDQAFDISGLNKAFESRIRLGVMSILAVNIRMDFNSLKEMLDVTDGNLSSHLTALEKLGYIRIYKQFVGKKPKTTYEISPAGKLAFQGHLNHLEKLIRMKGA